MGRTGRENDAHYCGPDYASNRCGVYPFSLTLGRGGPVLAGTRPGRARLSLATHANSKNARHLPGISSSVFFYCPRFLTSAFPSSLAGWTRLELATSCVTGRRSNQAELPPQQNHFVFDNFTLLENRKKRVFVTVLLAILIAVFRH